VQLDVKIQPLTGLEGPDHGVLITEGATEALSHAGFFCDPVFLPGRRRVVRGKVSCSGQGMRVVIAEQGFKSRCRCLAPFHGPAELAQRGKCTGEIDQADK